MYTATGRLILRVALILNTTAFAVFPLFADEETGPNYLGASDTQWEIVNEVLSPLYSVTDDVLEEYQAVDLRTWPPRGSIEGIRILRILVEKIEDGSFHILTVDRERGFEGLDPLFGEEEAILWDTYEAVGFGLFDREQGYTVVVKERTTGRVMAVCVDEEMDDPKGSRPIADVLGLDPEVFRQFELIGVGDFEDSGFDDLMASDMTTGKIVAALNDGQGRISGVVTFDPATGTYDGYPAASFGAADGTFSPDPSSGPSRADAATPSIPPAPLSERDAPSSSRYNSEAYIKVRNNFGRCVRIQLTHRYSDDATATQTWENVASGAVTDPWTVHFNTGFLRTGQDYWGIIVTDEMGNSWANDSFGSLQATLGGDKVGTTITFDAFPTRFSLWSFRTRRTVQYHQDYMRLRGRGTKGPKPIWAIEHQCNNTFYLRQAVADHGVNGVEFDVAYDKQADGTYKTSVKHHVGVQEMAKLALTLNSETIQRYLCDGGSVEYYLDAMLALSQQYSNYCLHYFDVKTEDLKDLNAQGRATKGMQLLDMIRTRLLEKGSPLYCVINIGDPAYADFVNGYAKAMADYPIIRQRVGVIVDQEGTWAKMRDCLAARNIPAANRWYAHGIDGLIPEMGKKAYIFPAINARHQGEMAKVIQWTLNKESSIESYLMKGVDGLMTDWRLSGPGGTWSDYGVITALRVIKNHPDLFRMATRSDNPFQVMYPYDPSGD